LRVRLTGLQLTEASEVAFYSMTQRIRLQRLASSLTSNVPCRKRRNTSSHWLVYWCYRIVKDQPNFVMQAFACTTLN